MDTFSGIPENLPLDQLVPKLKALNKDLAEKENDAKLSATDIKSYKTLVESLVKFSKSDEAEVHLLLSCCFVDILRIVAPVEILSQAKLKIFFTTLHKALSFLKSPESSVYPQVLHILQVLAETSCLVLGIKNDCGASLVRIIEYALENVEQNCGHTAEVLIGENVRIVLEELQVVGESYILPVVVSLAAEFKRTSRCRICVSVLNKVNSNVRGYVANYISSLFFPEKNSKKPAAVKENRFTIAYQLYKINHDYLLNLLCSISSLLTEKDSEKVIQMVGKIASCKKSSLHIFNSHLFHEFLQFFEHENEKVRCMMVGFLLRFCKNHPEAADLPRSILSHVAKRLRDTSEKVRQRVIQQICQSSHYIPLTNKIIKGLCERLKDVKKPIRKITIEELAKVYKNKCSSRYVLFDEIDEKYKNIINELLKNFRNSELDEQVAIVNSIEDHAIESSFDFRQRAKALRGMYQGLTEEALKSFEVIFKCKALWNAELKKTLASEDLQESFQVFCANLKTPLNFFTDKAQGKVGSGAVYEFFSYDDVRGKVGSAVEAKFYADVHSALISLQEVAKERGTAAIEAFNLLKARCFNILICEDQVELILHDHTLLNHFGKAYPQLLSPYFEAIVEDLLASSVKSPLFDLLSKISMKELPMFPKIEQCILDSFGSELCEDTKSAGKLLKYINPSLVQKLLKDLMDILSQPDIDKLASLIRLKSIIKSFPELIEKVKSKLKELCVENILHQHLDIESRIQAIKVLHCCVKHVGIYRETIFKLLLKLCVNLKSTLLKHGSMELSEVFTHEEESEVRIRCLKSVLSLLKVPECKGLLNRKALTYLAHVALNSSYQSALSSLLLNGIYDRSRLLPPLLSILALLTLASDSRHLKEALLHVLKQMKLNSLDCPDPDSRLKLQPEAYTPYLLYILSKCRVSEKASKAVLSTYIKILFKCHTDIDINYLMNLSKQLRKLSVSGKDVKSDLWASADKGLEIEKICSEFSVILVEDYLPKDYEEKNTRVLIPSSYFEKKADEISPLTNRSRGEESGVKRPLSTASNKKKQFRL